MAEPSDDGGDQRTVLPVVAVVGRPNVGKSTLVNRILGRREAVVQDIPGVTRDRVAYDAQWNGRRFTLVDTGGWEPDAKGLQAMVSAQAEYAVGTADLVLFVVDGRTGATETDLVVARTLRRAKRPVVLAATKIDDDRLESDAAQLWSLGLGEPYPVSGLHGRGSGDLLDAVLAGLPDAPPDTDVVGGPRRVALVGRPNVGKSSLLNRLTGETRSVVDSVAGTTIDPVDSLVELGGRDVALRRHRGPAPAGAPGQRHGVLRQLAHRGRDRERRGGDRAARCRGATHRAGPARHRRGGRRRARARDRVQQVGSR